MIQPFVLFVICYYLMVTGHCCESMTHRLTAVGAVTSGHKITTYITNCTNCDKLHHDITYVGLFVFVPPQVMLHSGGGKGKGAKGACAPGGTVQGAAFGGTRYGIPKFGCCWRISVCIADGDMIFLHP